MDKIFLDTNIILDLLEKRDGFYPEAQRLFTLADKKQVSLSVSALTIANLHYLLYKQWKTEAHNILSKFKLLVNVLPMDDKILNLALHSDFPDFEDAIQYYTAVENGIKLIISRNKKDFKNSKLPVLTAVEYLRRF